MIFTANRLFLCVFLTMMFSLPLIPSAAMAQDVKADGSKKYNSDEYSPSYCEFTATFPEEPYISHRCDSNNPDSCYDLISYTKVFDVAATVNVEIICNPSSEKMYEHLTQDAMKTTVRAMTKNTIIEAYEVSAREDTHYRQAGLIGKARSGTDDAIYIAQLWSGKKSIMSVEAKLSGAPIEDADVLFADILRSIGYVDDIKQDVEADKAEKKSDKAEKKEKPAASTPEKKKTPTVNQ